MNLKIITNRGRAGYALISVLMMAAIGLCIYAATHAWISTTTTLNERNNIYNRSLSAAEAASERVVSYVARDFLNQSFDPASLNSYRALVPVDDWAADYRFSDAEGHDGQTGVTSSTTMVTTNLESQFKGLYGLVYTCKVTGQAEPLNTSFDVRAAVQQDLQLASIPIFQFAIFYSMDLEINPGPVMTITGKVHSNADMYLAPQTGLRFLDDVGATGRIFFHRHEVDGEGGGKVMPLFDEDYLEKVSSLTLPIASNNSPATVRAILEPPPFGEDPNSPAGKARYYNNCDLIITTTSSNLVVKTGKWNSFEQLTPDVNTGKTNASFSFIRTNVTFYDRREKKNTIVTEVDVGKLRTWMTNAGGSVNGMVKFNTGHDLNSVYVDDQRGVSGKLTAVRLTNGRHLPNSGLTVATRLPLYVKGHLNAPNASVGYTNTSSTEPASLVADAVTLLSENWSDSITSAMPDASDTTVNAAILAGIVPSVVAGGTKHYSGGVENFPRFLEDWGGRSLTYNGSMVVMFPSRFATNYWVSPGTYYQAPNRKWAFDVNFLDYNKLPPATPQVRKLIRGQWKVVAAKG